MTDRIDTMAERDRISSTGRLFLDEDGDICREGAGDNLVAVAAVGDGPDYCHLNPDAFRSIPRTQSTLLDALAEIDRLRAENERLRDELGNASHAFSGIAEHILECGPTRKGHQLAGRIRGLSKERHFGAQMLGEGGQAVRNGNRPWCAKARYPGLKPFIGGTVIIPSDAKSHEIEVALTEHFREFLPDGFEIIEPVCGALFFTEVKP